MMEKITGLINAPFTPFYEMVMSIMNRLERMLNFGKEWPEGSVC